MSKITAAGVPSKYPDLGDIRIVVDGTETEIQGVSFEVKLENDYEPAPGLEGVFDDAMKQGPGCYVPVQEPETMSWALAILCEWYGGYPECWNSVQVDGEIGEEIEYDPDAIY
jgi:hypothetical protein